MDAVQGGGVSGPTGWVADKSGRQSKDVMTLHAEVESGIKAWKIRNSVRGMGNIRQRIVTTR